MQKQITPHKHSELIKVWADNPDTKFQFFVPNYCDWRDIDRPSWNLNYEYRIKPEPKLDTVLTGQVSSFYEGGCTDGNDNRVGFLMFQKSTYQLDTDNLKLTFDGETGKLKAAEVITK